MYIYSNFAGMTYQKKIHMQSTSSCTFTILNSNLFLLLNFHKIIIIIHQSFWWFFIVQQWGRHPYMVSGFGHPKCLEETLNWKRKLEYFLIVTTRLTNKSTFVPLSCLCFMFHIIWFAMTNTVSSLMQGSHCFRHRIPGNIQVLSRSKRQLSRL